MTTTELNNFQIGDKVIYVKGDGAYIEAPQITEVVKTTKKQFRVAARDVAFHAPKSEFHRKNGCDQVGKGYGTYDTVYDYSEEKLEELTKSHEKSKARYEEKQAEKQAQREERQRYHDEKLEELKKKLSFNDFTRQQLPDGSRMYQGYIPLEAGDQRQFLFISIHVKKNQSSWVREGEEIEAYYTSYLGSSSSYPSCGGSLFASDEEGVMECALSALRW